MLELLRKNFQLAMVVFLCSCAIVAIAPFAVIRFLAGDYLIAILDAAIVVFMVALLVMAFKSVSLDLISLILAASYTVGAIAIIYLRTEETLYWVYPVIMANYFVLSIRLAVTLNGLVLLAVIPLYPYFDSHFEFLGVVVTQLLVNAMASIFSWKTRSQNEELQILATRDPLTGILNRRSLDDIVSNAIARFQRYGEPASLILIDIDHFKFVNDTFGHEKGDQVLCDVAALLTDYTRSASDSVFRMGGEEFLVLVGRSELSEAVQVAEKIRQEIPRRLTTADGPIQASFGCAQLRSGENQDDWIGRADQALYLAKSEGRNCVRPLLPENTPTKESPRVLQS